MGRWGRPYGFVENGGTIEDRVENREGEGSIRLRIPTTEMRVLSFSYLLILCYLNYSPTVLNRPTTPFQQWSTDTDQLSNLALPQTDLPSSRRLQIPYTV
jgi:hypothetical protein